MRANPAFIALSLLLASLATLAPAGQATHTCATALGVPETSARAADSVSNLAPDFWYSHTTTTGVASYTLQPGATTDVNIRVVAANCTTVKCQSGAGVGVADRCSVSGPAGSTFYVHVSWVSGPGTYSIGFRPDCEVAPGVSFCIIPDTSAVLGSHSVRNVDDIGDPYTVVAYHDLYRFVLPSGPSVTVDCIVLAVNGSPPNVCEELGTFVRRFSVLVDESQNDLEETTVLQTVSLCQAVLSLTVAGRGVNSAPTVATC